MTRLVSAVIRAPFTARLRREISFCALGLPLVLPLPAVAFAVTSLVAPASGPSWGAAGDPSPWAVAIFWGAGLVNLSFPFWWLSFRNHPRVPG